MAQKSISMIMRKLHRDLGFLAVGLTLIYALSGILLMFRGSDFMMKEVKYEKLLEKELNPQELEKEIGYRRFRIKSESDEKIEFNVGTYDKISGIATYQLNEYITPFKQFVALHKITSKSPALWFMIGYGIILSFLAISGLFMFKPSTQLFRRGIVLTIIGLAIATIFCFVVA
ncbi:MAG: hypothetical protein ACRCZM_09470 [Bacteroidales bacterium]